MPHPRILCEELIENSAELVASGYKTGDVYAHPDVNVSAQTWYRWRATGKELDEQGLDPEDIDDEYDALCLKFWRALQTAEVMRKNELVKAWRAHSLAESDWRAMRDWLRANYPEEFSERRNLDVTSGGDKVELNIVLTSDEDYEEEDE